MTPRLLLATDLVVSVLRHRAESMRARFIDAGDRAVVSSVTVAELVFAAERSTDAAANRAAIAAFLDRVPALPFDAHAAAHAGEVGAELARGGRRIGAYDALIAGHARSAGLAVVTRAPRVFAGISGLELVDWSE